MEWEEVGDSGEGEMGYKTEFNWALKLKPEEGLEESGLEENKDYEFTKKEMRIYPIKIPIDLINNNWEAVAKIVILKCKIGDGKTSGLFNVIKIYQGQEKEILTNYWRENVTYLTNRTNYPNIKVS